MGAQDTAGSSSSNFKINAAYQANIQSMVFMVPINIGDECTVRLPVSTWLDKGNFRLFRVESSRATFSFPAGYRAMGEASIYSGVATRAVQ